MNQKYATVLWEDGDLAEKVQGVGLEEDSVFGVLHSEQ